MPFMRLFGVFSIIPTTIFLALSFFVLFTLRKVDLQGLKAFGYVVAALLWVCAAIAFGVGVYTVSTGRHPMMPMMQRMMQGSMQQSPMIQQQMMNR